MGFTPGLEIISQYFSDLTDAQLEHFHRLSKLYRHWNQRINVISRKDMDQFYQNHVLHSLGIAKVHQFQEHDRVLDLGTGGGFPGIPLAILYPKAQFHLIDSIGKKVKVVQEVIDRLALYNVSCQQIRAEDIDQPYDFVVTRAVAPLKKLLPWVNTSLASGGQLLCLKGGDLEEEIREVQAKVITYQLRDFFKEPYFDTKKVLRIKRLNR